MNSSSKNRQSNGSGLGLYNAKKIVQLHGGEIWVENQPDVSTEFIFTLLKDHPDGDNQ